MTTTNPETEPGPTRAEKMMLAAWVLIPPIIAAIPAALLSFFGASGLRHVFNKWSVVFWYAVSFVYLYVLLFAALLIVTLAHDVSQAVMCATEAADARVPWEYQRGECILSPGN